MTIDTRLEGLLAGGILQAIDVAFAQAMLELTGDSHPDVALGLALASRAPQNGHVCLSLNHVGQTIRTERGTGDWLPDLPAPDAWRQVLLASSLVAPPDGPPSPLLLDGDRLYLRRFWEYQAQLAADLQRRAIRMADPDPAAFRQALRLVFPGQTDARQQLAVVLASLRHLTVITGGPGTGKTTTVTRLMGLLQALAGDQPLRIALAAPTGKAATRMADAIRQRRQDLPDALQEKLPVEATTIHRLLGYQRRTPAHFRHDRDNPLPYDVVIVDEASMIPLSLMAKLVTAIPEDARLIFLGDRDQLASVEAGAVLNDLCPPAETPEHGYSRDLTARLQALDLPVPGELVSSQATTGIRDSIVHLTTSHRFGADSGIGNLARAINGQHVDEAMAILRSGAQDVRWIEVDGTKSALDALRQLVLDQDWRPAADMDPMEALIRLERFSLLAAHRQGALGVAGLNTAVQRWLRESGILQIDEECFAGRPVLVTENDNEQRLYNGDIGVVLPTPEGRRRVFFPGLKGQPWRALAPSRLPAHETAFALTIHKSQGSEFDRVVIVLPERESPILTKELIYTAITRARKEVTIVGSATVLVAGISVRVQRASGLQGMLWGNPSAEERDSAM